MWHLTDEDGLPSNTVYCIAQDSKGFIWMGTEKGVCRFDGKVFKYFNSAALNDQEVLKIEIDIYDRIWFLNLSGQLFYVEGEQIHLVESIFPEDLVFVVDMKVKDKTVWVTLKENNKFRIAYFSLEDRQSFSTPFYFNSIYSRVSFFLEDGENLCIVSTPVLVEASLELILLDDRDTTLNIQAYFDRFDFMGYQTSYFYGDQQFVYSYHPENLISKYKEEKLSPFLWFEKSKTINSLIAIEEDFWIMTAQGIFKTKANTGGALKEPYLLKDIATNHLFIDQEGNKWISTTGNGVYVVTASQTKVFQSGNSDLPRNEIYSLEYDDSNGQLLIGHDKGLVSSIDSQFLNQVYQLPNTGRTLKTISEKNGDYWLATDNGLVELSKGAIPRNRMPTSMKTLLKAKDGSLWYTSYCCVYRVPKEYIDNFDPRDLGDKIEIVFNGKTYALHQDFSDDIWFGSINGIYIYKQGEVRPFLENGKHLPYNVSSISQTPDSVIWVGTRGDGVIGIKNGRVVYRHKTPNNLASNTIKKILGTDQHLWIGTDNGLNKLDLKTRKWEWINNTDGLPSNEVNDLVVVDDQIWVGTTKGLVQFSVSANHFNNKPPRVLISGLKIEDKNTTLKNSLDLDFDKNSIQVDFIGIGFKAKGDVSYQYKMSGVDKSWVTTKSRFARYPNLAPGDYLFEVLAINDDQVSSAIPASINFVIHPPWWKTWWFRILMLCSIAAILTFFVNARIQQQRKEQEFLDQVNALKTQALRAQMNPHFIFNALNAIQKFLTTNDREQAMRYLSRFGKLIRLIFVQSQKEAISLEDELEFLNLYLNLEKLRFMDKVDIQVVVCPDLLEISDEIYIPPLLIQPIIENSFKHGFLYKEKPGRLTINFSKKEAYLICTIEDDGIGRKKAAELGQIALKDRPSSGLKIAHNRLSIYEPDPANLADQSGIQIIDLYEKNGAVRGTLVEVKIYCKGF